jgi:hypothetical protein
MTLPLSFLLGIVHRYHQRGEPCTARAHDGSLDQFERRAEEQVHMVGPDVSLEDFDVVRLADLANQVA